MNLETLLTLFETLPDGKTVVPLEIIVDKLGTDVFVSLKIRLKIPLDKQEMS